MPIDPIRCHGPFTGGGGGTITLPCVHVFRHDEALEAALGDDESATTLVRKGASTESATTLDCQGTAEPP